MNAFDRVNYPTREPQTLIAGDRVMWKRSDLGADYPPASYALKYSARKEAAEATPEIEITAVADGSDFIVEVPAATSAAWTAGRYRWQAYITRNSDGQRITVGIGAFEVKLNSELATGDARTHARRVLDAIEAVIEKRATQDQSNYSIQGRSLSRTPIADLLVLRDRYRAEAASELAAEQIAAGLGNPRNFGVRFNRV